MNNVFYVQLEQLCSKSGLSISTFVTDKLHMSKGNIKSWKDGSTPSIKVLQKIADYFGVTTDYLLNGQKDKPPVETRSLSDIENEILTIYSNLPEDKKQAFMTVARSLKSQSKDK